MKRTAFSVCWLVLAAGLAGCTAVLSAADPDPSPAPPAQLSAMAGYHSVFEPAHIDSAEAKRRADADPSAAILDVRSAASYAERHVKGAANAPAETLPDYAAANLPDKSQTVICYCFCGDKGGAALAACGLLAGMGYTNAVYTEPGGEWEYEGTAVTDPPASPAAHAYITGAEARALYESRPGVILLDVRTQEEYDLNHIDGSTLIPVAELPGRLDELPDKGATVIVYCRSGVRSASAYDLLTQNGYTHVYDMQRIGDWK